MAARARPLTVVPKESKTPLESAGHEWLAHLRAEGRSVKTLYDRERNIFSIVLPLLKEQGITEPEQVTSRVVDQLAVTLAEGSRSPSTVATYMRDVKSFLRWLTAEGDLEKAPTFPKVAQPLRHPEVLTDAEYKKLVVAAERQHPRDAVMVRVMGEAGLRASEVIGLREGGLMELSGGRYQLRVIGQGQQGAPRLRPRPTWAATSAGTSASASRAAAASSSRGCGPWASTAR